MKDSAVENNSSSTSAAVLILAIALLLSSCASPNKQLAVYSDANKLGLAPAPLPQYKAGTKFVYSNGTWESVARVGPEGVTWVNHRGNESRGSADFTYKRVQWQTRDRQGRREFSQTEFWLGQPTTTLWPLKPGNRTRYNEEGTWSASGGTARSYDSYWSCEVIGTERVSVVAGDFDTWKITCKRYSNRFRSTSKTREYRTWYYAPAVNHWVLEIRDYNGYRENRRKELAAVLPDLATYTAVPENITSLKRQFQNTLESAKRGATEVWEHPGEQLLVSMTPRKSFRLGNGDICRQYYQTFDQSGYRYEYPGIACRNDEGRWLVPRR